MRVRSFSSCARGYSAVYTGRAGGIENYQQSFGARGQTKTMCVDTTASVQTDYSSQTDVLMRLFRYTNDGVGMDADTRQALLNGLKAKPDLVGSIPLKV